MGKMHSNGEWLILHRILVCFPYIGRFVGKFYYPILILLILLYGTATFLSPPSEPFIAVVERETVLQVTVVGAYAYVISCLLSFLWLKLLWGYRWSCLGVWLANLARTELNLNATQDDIIHGRYIEAAVSYSDLLVRKTTEFWTSRASSVLYSYASGRLYFCILGREWVKENLLLVR